MRIKAHAPLLIKRLRSAHASPYPMCNYPDGILNEKMTDICGGFVAVVEGFISVKGSYGIIRSVSDIFATGIYIAILSGDYFCCSVKRCIYITQYGSTVYIVMALVWPALSHSTVICI